MENNSDEAAGKFTVLLNGQQDLDQHLTEFKKACVEHESKHHRKRSKKRYYNLALMAKIVCQTTAEELKRLLKNGTKTFLFDTITNKPDDLERMAQAIRVALKEQQSEEPFSQLVIGLALQITGDCCRIARIRNNCSMLAERGNTMTLTSDISYIYSGFKEISYAINLHYYLQTLRLDDEIEIGPEVRGRIVKIAKGNLVLEIQDPGIINSYDVIKLPKQCYMQQAGTFQDMFRQDLELAAKIEADFVVMPNISCRTFLKVLRYHLKDKYNFKLIGNIDLNNVSEKTEDIRAIIKSLDLVWLPNLFNLTQKLHSFVCQYIIPMAKCLNKPIIGSVPLERCSDFRVFENHEFLWKIDCILMEKSAWCHKYPLIVKKLLPIKDYRRAVMDNSNTLLKTLPSYQSVVNFVIRTISSIDCQAIFIHSKCETTVAALSRVEIYCPVYVLLPLEMEDDEGFLYILQLAKVLNLRRNLHSIIYSRDMNEFGYKPTDFGIEYARSCGVIKAGDFIITIQVGKEDDFDGNGIQLGMGEDVVIMRAFYVAPMNVGEKFKC